MVISKSTLAEMYASMKTEDLRKALGNISPNTLYRLLDSAGIPRKGPNKRPRNFITVEGI